ATVEGDPVARAGDRPADGGVIGPRPNLDALSAVGESAALHPDADRIALDPVARRPGGEDDDPVDRVAGDDLAAARDRAADGIVRRPVVEADPVQVRYSFGPGDIATDYIALHEVAGGGREQLDTVLGVAGQDVPRARGRPADRVVEGRIANPDAADLVGHGL